MQSEKDLQRQMMFDYCSRFKSIVINNFILRVLA